jgi:hypothetical protein
MTTEYDDSDIVITDRPQAAHSMKACAFQWSDHPKPQATTDRGWVHLVNHPDSPEEQFESDCCGNYCTYDLPGGSRGPAGETVHACAYIFRFRGLDRRQENIGLGACWFHTIDAAKAFIEHNVRAYFGVVEPEHTCRRTFPELLQAAKDAGLRTVFDPQLGVYRDD